MVIRFVFPTVQHNDTGIPPIERAVSPVPYVVVVVAQTDRIGIADFMVATHKESRYTVATHSFCQFTDKTGCLIMVHRVVYTVTIEDNEVIIDILDLLNTISSGAYPRMEALPKSEVGKSVPKLPEVEGVPMNNVVLELSPHNVVEGLLTLK